MLFLGCMGVVALFVMGVVTLNTAHAAIQGEWLWMGGRRWRPPNMVSSFLLCLVTVFSWSFGLYSIVFLLS